jgi:uncharacterized protein GlcG (DUF336 family)
MWLHPSAVTEPIRKRWNLRALKAYTARTGGQTSLKNLTDKPENAYLKQIPNGVAVGDGVPIKVGNEMIGTVGVSGAPDGDKDETCANIGIGKVAGSSQ